MTVRASTKHVSRHRKWEQNDLRKRVTHSSDRARLDLSDTSICRIRHVITRLEDSSSVSTMSSRSVEQAYESDEADDDDEDDDARDPNLFSGPAVLCLMSSQPLGVRDGLILVVKHGRLLDGTYSRD